MIRVQVGTAVVEVEAVELRTGGGETSPRYSVADLLNATVRTLRAIGTEDAAAAIDRLDGVIGDDSELEHAGDAPGTFDGVRVPFPAAPSGYVWLSPEALLQAAAVQLEGAAGLPDVLSLNVAQGARLGLVLEQDGHTLNPRDYVVDRLEAAGTFTISQEERRVPAAIVAYLRPVPMPDYR